VVPQPSVRPLHLDGSADDGGGLGVEGREDGLVVVVVLHGDVVRLVGRAARTDDESDEQGDGVKDVDEADDGRDAEDERAGEHHALRERCVVHHGGLF